MHGNKLNGLKIDFNCWFSYEYANYEAMVHQVC